MKKLILAAASAAFLSVSCNSQPVSPAEESDGQTVTVAEVSSLIAYVDLEVLMERYELVVELGQALEEKATKAENELTSKGRSLERAVADAQEKIEKGLVTRAQAAELQEKLQRQEQSFYQHRERVQMELAEENQVMMNNIYHSLTSFIEEFNHDYRYGVILTTSGITPILHADPRLDITELVLEALNEKYAQEKKNGGE
ncbi:MAG: OmpH family outer membrane protein [Rikenellaceae bacterium]|nr:OmpH family outer membrane protein [Rikenellaceae bacterium]